MKTSDPLKKGIDLDKGYILDDVCKRSAYYAEKSGDANIEALPHDSQVLADFWRQACAACVNLCVPYVESHSEASDVVDDCDSSKDFHIALNMPAHFGTEYLSAVEEALNEYAIQHILAEWLKHCGATAPEEAALKSRDSYGLHVRELLTIRKAPVRTSVMEDLGNLKYL